jgi:hypothetical protein
MDDETRDLIRMAVSGQKEEPVTLETGREEPDGHGPPDGGGLTVSPDEVMVEISGRENKIEAFVDRMRPYGISELVRTGRIAMVRSASSETHPADDAGSQSA